MLRVIIALHKSILFYENIRFSLQGSLLNPVFILINSRNFAHIHMKHSLSSHSMLQFPNKSLLSSVSLVYMADIHFSTFCREYLLLYNRYLFFSIALLKIFEIVCKLQNENSNYALALFYFG